MSEPKKWLATVDCKPLTSSGQLCVLGSWDGHLVHPVYYTKFPDGGDEWGIVNIEPDRLLSFRAPDHWQFMPEAARSHA